MYNFTQNLLKRVCGFAISHVVN